MLCCLRPVHSIYVYFYIQSKKYEASCPPLLILQHLFFLSIIFTTSLRVQECQLHRGEKPTSKNPFTITHGVYHSVYVCPPPSLCSCIAYNGNECTSVFGAANLTSTSVGGSISTTDSTIETNLALSTSISQDCLNYARLVQCLSLYSPCSGTAWCGSMSETELTDAVSTACGCSGSSCTVGGISVATIRTYYQGSSSTGQVGSARLSCQDVTLGELEVYICMHNNV